MSDKSRKDYLDGLSEIDTLLGVVLEGASDDSDRERFLELVSMDERFSVDLKDRALHLFSGGGVDLELCQELLSAMTEGDDWQSVSDVIREDLALDEVVVGEAFDPAMVDSVMSAIGDLSSSATVADVDEKGLLLSRLVDGELSESERVAFTAQIADDDWALKQLSDHADLGRLLRESMSAKLRRVDFAPMWVAVSEGIGLESPEYVEGWAPVAAVIREVVEEAANLSDEQSQRMLSAVMSEVEKIASNDAAAFEFELALAEAKAPRRRWFSFLPHAVAFAGVVAVLLVSPILGGGGDTQEGELDTVEMEYAEVDLAEMETLEYADDVLVQVIVDVEGDGPLIIFVDEDVDQVDEMDWEDDDWGDDWGDDDGWDTASEAI